MVQSLVRVRSSKVKFRVEVEIELNCSRTSDAGGNQRVFKWFGNATRTKGGVPPAAPSRRRLLAIFFPLKVGDKCSRLTTSYLPKRDLGVGIVRTRMESTMESFACIDCRRERQITTSIETFLTGHAMF